MHPTPGGAVFVPNMTHAYTPLPPSLAMPGKTGSSFFSTPSLHLLSLLCNSRDQVATHWPGWDGGGGRQTDVHSDVEKGRKLWRAVQCAGGQLPAGKEACRHGAGSSSGQAGMG